MARQHYNLRTWRRIQWSTRVGSCLRHICMAVWVHTNTVYVHQHQAHCPLWWRINNDLDMVTVREKLNQYIRDIFNLVVASLFHNDLLAPCPVFMVDSASPHRSYAVRAFLQTNAITTLPWSATSLDINSLEHIWDCIGRRVQARDASVHNVTNL